VKIIEICTDFKNTLQEQKISSLKRIFKPLSTSESARFDGAIVAFQNHRKLVETEAHLSHMVEESKARGMALHDKEEAEKRARGRLFNVYIGDM
jgi:hypothetical protein